MLIGLGPDLLAFPFAAPDCHDVDGLLGVHPDVVATLGAEVAGHPVSSPDGTTVVAAVGTDLWALRATTGETLWHGVLGAAATAAPATDGHTVFVPTADGDLETFALGGCGAAPLCTTRWRGITGSRSPCNPRSPAASSTPARRTARSARSPPSGCGASTTCAATWSKKVGSTVTGAPAVTDGRLYVGTAAGRLVSFSPGGA